MLETASAPTVSVVIKSYNHAKYIGQTLESVFAQSFEDFEIIVTDDGSVDGTPDVVRGFGDPRIQLEVLPTNTGLSRAMNSACARARGRYIAILNSDDYALPNRLAKQVAHMDRSLGTGAVFTSVKVVDEDGRPLSGNAAFDAPATWPVHSRARWLRHFFDHGNCLCAPSAMVRRSVLSRVGPYDPRLTNLQDLDMWVRLAIASDIDFLTEPLSAFRIRSGDRNLSAPRPDTQIRSQFEYAMILRRYAEMDVGLVREIFDDVAEALGVETEGDKRRFMAERACQVGNPAHQWFGLETYFGAASEGPHYDRLRNLTGSVDVFQYLASPSNPWAPQPIDPALVAAGPCIVAHGQRLTPIISADHAVFTIPAGTQAATLTSPTRAVRAGDLDQRQLGFVVRSIKLVFEDCTDMEVDISDPALDRAFFPLEEGTDATWRWTRAQGPLPLDWYYGRPGEVEVHFVGDFDAFNLTPQPAPETGRRRASGLRRIFGRFRP